MSDMFRDSTFGQLINWSSNGRFLPYADQKPDYVVPERYLLRPAINAPTMSSSGAPTLVDADGATTPKTASKGDEEKGDVMAEALRQDGVPPVTEKVLHHPYLVTWDGDDDQDNPRNWSPKKRNFFAFIIMTFTFSIYVASAIYTSSIPSLMADFDVSLVVATLGLTLYVAAYGIGPMLLSPLQDMPMLGRNPTYIAGMFLFVLFQLPILLAKNFGTILVFRFLSGFVGSPALATGGSSLGDVFPGSSMAIVIGLWSVGAVCGPIVGPVIGGFAAQANGWRWPIFEIVWIAGPVLILMVLLLPETLESTILLRRAQRLRKLTGNHLLRSQSEIDASGNESVARLALTNITLAMKLTLEPAVLFANTYLGLVYAIFYLWFEAFPLVYNDIYHFNLGLAGLPFLGFCITGVLAFIFYVWYQQYHLAGRYAKNPNLQPEVRFELALAAGGFIIASLLIFGWTARANVHWIAPTIGAAIYLPGIYYTFQSIFMYLTFAYPRYRSSVFAGNALFRSTIASVFPLFGHAFFSRLGLGGGSTLLAGLSALMLPFLYYLMARGGNIRAGSKYAN